MLQIIYLIAFTILAVLAISNLIRSMINFGLESQRQYQPINNTVYDAPTHPELLDETGNMINEPLLVMKSITVDDARAKLDAIYNASPTIQNDQPEE
jgi:hypothetical protein